MYDTMIYPIGFHQLGYGGLAPPEVTHLPSNGRGASAMTYYPPMGVVPQHDQPASQPASQPTNQPTKPTHQPTSNQRATNKPASQPTSQPTNQ